MRCSVWLAALALLIALPAAAANGAASAGPLAEAVSVRALRFGDAGPAVAELQRLLAANGFDPGPVDGIFGPLTEAAVLAAQRHYGLTVDGLAGRMTVGALQSRPQAPVTAAAYDVPERGEGALVVYEASPLAAPRGGDAGTVALTFHHLPAAEELSALLDALRAQGARATFFVTGDEAERRPADLGRIRADGHEIGSLGYREVDLRDRPAVAVRLQLRRASQAIERAVGERPALLRPPLGRFDRQLRRLAAEEGLDLVLWSNAVAAPGAGAGPVQLADHALRALHPGAVLMLPLDVPGGVEAAKRVLAGIAAAGYRAVPQEPGVIDNS